MNDATLEAIEGVIEDVVFRSDDGGFVVCRLAPKQEQELITVVGELGSTMPGESLRLKGTWTKHPTYGARFKVTSFTPILPSTRDGIVRYLGSGLISGIGPALAQRIVDRFGDETLEVIATQSQRLSQVSGIGKQRAASIAEAVRTRREEAEALSYLHGLGIGPLTARRLMKQHGEQAPQLIRDDPFLIAEKTPGMGFRSADRIAEAIGIEEDDPRRIAGAILHAVGKATDEGHVFLPYEHAAPALDALGVNSESMDEVIVDLVSRELLIKEDNALYPPPLYVAEQRVAQTLRKLAQPKASKEIKGAAKERAEQAAAELSETQKSAVSTSLRNGLMVLTGGPGTGKTTTVRALVEAHLAREHRVILCAPTGRAAKRLSEATGYEAKTIHRLLEWNPAHGRFYRNREQPLDAELVLVDEASMLDLRLADHLLDAIAPATSLVLVGDVDQLPPIGPGQVLRDLIDADIAPVVRLKEIFRQLEASAIVSAAYQILHGEVPTSTQEPQEKSGDFFVIEAREPEVIQERLVRALERLKATYKLNPKNDVQVLSPMRKGPLGIETLNALLQRELNPLSVGGQKTPQLCPGDKVMQLKNNYDKDVFNGDLGYVTRVEGGSTFIDFDGREVQHDADSRNQIALAYASTVHKVQGSEFPAVVVVLHNAHYVLLNRALLYTAVTRAKQVVVIITTKYALRRAVENRLSYECHSKLRERLSQEHSLEASDPS